MGQISSGAALIQRFDWILFIFGAFLVYTGYKMATSHGGQMDPGAKSVLRWVRKVLPVTEKL